MPEDARILGLVAALVEHLAEHLVADCMPEEWVAGPIVGRLRETVAVLEEHGKQVPPPVRAALAMVGVARRR